jgi:carbon-monoxide dehydrogenase medium subunit
VALVRGNGSSGIGLVNMGSTPVRAAAAESALSGGASDADAAAAAAEGTEPSADLNASADFRRHLARVLVGRALTESATP